MTNYFNRLDDRELALNGFSYSVSFTLSFLGNETKYLQIKTGAVTCWISDYQLASSAEPLSLTAIESPTLTNGTTALPSFCTNRQRANTATTLFYSNPTSVSGGTVIHREVCTAGKGAGASLTDSHNWILKKNTSYLWKIEQLTNQVTTVAGELLFREGYPSAQ
jgi:hypothetical protein